MVVESLSSLPLDELVLGDFRQVVALVHPPLVRGQRAHRHGSHREVVPLKLGGGTEGGVEQKIAVNSLFFCLGHVL